MKSKRGVGSKDDEKACLIHRWVREVAAGKERYLETYHKVGEKKRGREEVNGGKLNIPTEMFHKRLGPSL